MFKFALGVLFSALVLALSPVPHATAKEGTTATAKKPSAKKKTLRKRKAAANNNYRLVRRVVKVNGKRKVVYQRVARYARAVPAPLTAGDLAGLNKTRDPLDLRSSVALVLDGETSEVLFEKNASVALPIASITKLMTGLIVVQAGQDMDEILTITNDDVDREKFTGSRLAVGTRMRRGDLLHIALMSSENRAASALGRHYPGGLPAFVAAMNAKARELGMLDTHYVDSSGLSSRNVASARDLARLVAVAAQEPLLREYSTDEKAVVKAGRRKMRFGTTNYLVGRPDWNIGLQKTGFINEAGRCLVMQAAIARRNVIMVFLDSKGRQSRTADARRMRKWIEELKPPVETIAGTH